MNISSCKNAGSQVEKREKTRSRITVGKMWDMLTGSLINDLTHASQNSRVFRLKDFVFKKTNAVFLFVCLFVVVVFT